MFSAAAFSVWSEETIKTSFGGNHQFIPIRAKVLANDPSKMILRLTVWRAIAICHIQMKYSILKGSSHRFPHLLIWIQISKKMI